jgi:hypothetical protein
MRDNRRRYQKDPSFGDQLRLAVILSAVRQADEAKDYELRNKGIVTAMALCIQMGIPAGIRLDPSEPEWPVVYMQLPTGQVSYHIPQFDTAWDNHTTEEKNERIETFVRNIFTEAQAARSGQNRPRNV